MPVVTCSKCSTPVEHHRNKEGKKIYFCTVCAKVVQKVKVAS